MIYYILLLTIFLVLIPLFTYFINPKLTNYTKELYKIKDKKQRYNIKFFTFLPKKKSTKPFYLKLIRISFVTSALFFILFMFNYQEPDVYYKTSKLAELTLEKLEQLDPFRNANWFLMLAMYLLVIYSIFINLISTALLLENTLAISFYKLIELTIKSIKKFIIFIFSKSLFLYKKLKTSTK